MSSAGLHSEDFPVNIATTKTTTEIDRRVSDVPDADPLALDPLAKSDDLRIASITPLSSPEAVMAELPREPEIVRRVQTARSAIADILRGEDDRLVVVIGPCSVHDPEAALDYAARLAVQRRRHRDTLEIVMRVYFEKPRTTVGWKGMINDPHLDGSFAIETGLRRARGLLQRINEMGLPAGCEFLDTTTPQYFADLVAWGAIGARTTESQIHRELASGLSCPVGFKNGTDGSVAIALDAVQAAAQPHHFLAVTKEGRAAIAETTGNPDCHVILRGGRSGTNFDAASIDAVCAKAEAAGVRPQVMIDASHANSAKQPENQPRVVDTIAEQVAGGDRRIMGVMVESFLEAGRQDPVPGEPLVYGRSITDGCIDWQTSMDVLDRLSAAVEQRRRA